MIFRTIVYLMMCIVGIVALVLFNLEILGLGELELVTHIDYILLWLTFFLPLATLGAIVAGWRPSRIPSYIHIRLLFAYSVTVLIMLELSFLLDLAWQWMVVQYFIGFFVFVGVRLIAISRVGRSLPDKP